MKSAYEADCRILQYLSPPTSALLTNQESPSKRGMWLSTLRLVAAIYIAGRTLNYQSAYVRECALRIRLLDSCIDLGANLKHRVNGVNAVNAKAPLLALLLKAR
jgi:hypothetical protein